MRFKVIWVATPGVELGLSAGPIGGYVTVEADDANRVAGIAYWRIGRTQFPESDSVLEMIRQSIRHNMQAGLWICVPEQNIGHLRFSWAYWRIR